MELHQVVEGNELTDELLLLASKLSLRVTRVSEMRGVQIPNAWIVGYIRTKIELFFQISPETIFFFYFSPDIELSTHRDC